MYGKYTVELKSLIESPEVKPLLDKALSTYPLFTPVDNAFVKELIPTREELNQKLLNHYKYREIGFETVGRFLEELEIAMNEIMPYYNQLYKSVEIMSLIEDPFGNVDVTETFEQETTDNSSADSKTTASDSSSINSKTKALNSTMPQGNISVEEMENVSHADNASWGKDSSSSEGSSEGSTETSSESKGTVKHTFTKKGNQGVSTYAHDMNELRETFLNVTAQIVDDVHIRELFLNVF